MSNMSIFKIGQKAEDIFESPHLIIYIEKWIILFKERNLQQVLPKKYVHFFTDNIVQKPRSGQICHLITRALLLSSKIVDIYIPFSKTEKSLREKEA